MVSVKELRCPLCGRSYQLDSVQYFCADCGQVGTLDILYDYDLIKHTLDRDTISASREQTMWRYRALLPVDEAVPVPPLAVGWTPLYDAPRLAELLSLRQVSVKDDGRNPTASLKDRASALVVARAVEQGFRVVSTASTGNAAAALAGLSAAARIKSIIFVPSSAPEAKIAQLLVYGATVLLVEASYDVAFDLCYEACLSEGWYCRNTALNPFTTEGKKTAAYEIAEQLGWHVPDVVVVSVGDGNIIAGVYKGFYDLYHLGWIPRIPRLIGVQAEGSAPLVNAWRHNISAQDMQPIEAHTIADSISAGIPRDRAKALRAVQETQGAFLAVSDAEIIQSIPILARLTGIFAEPAAAASFAGAKRAVESGLIHADEHVLLLLTGNGLKDIKRAQESVNPGIRVQPDIASILEAIQRL